MIKSALLAVCVCAWVHCAQAQTEPAAATGASGYTPLPGTPGLTPETGTAGLPPIPGTSTLAPGTRVQSATLAVTEGIGETDNVFLTPNDKQSQTISSTDLNVGFVRQGSALSANVAGDFDYIDYLQNAYSGQLLSRFDGFGAWSFWGDRLKWVLQDDYGETQLDAFTPITPTNLENTNLLQTGPDLTLRPADQTVLQVGARYALSTYQTSPLDGWRSLENVMLERELSGSSNVSLNANFMQLHFDSADDTPNYNNNRYFVEYAIKGARTQLDIAGGVSQTNAADSSFTTPYAKLDLTRQLSPETSLTLTAGRDLTDAADAFGALRAGAAGGITVAPVAQTMDPYVRNYASVGWRFDGRQTVVAITGRYERDTYDVDQILDFSDADVELTVSRQLSSVLTAEVSGSYSDYRYINQGSTDTQYAAAGDIAWQMGRTLTLRVRFAHNFSSTTGAGFGYSANEGAVMITYRPLQVVPQVQ